MSKRKIAEKRKKAQSIHRLSIGICAVVFILVVAGLFYVWSSQLEPNGGKLWYIIGNGTLDFTDRGAIQAHADPVENGTSYTVEKVVYTSFGDNVYALLRIPRNVTKPPVVIVIPAANITKEQDAPTARALCDMGYASLTLDKRGWGETQGENEGDFDAGIANFTAGGDPVQYKQVYDVLKALDYVKSRPDLDGNDVALLGESRGGVWAIDAAGIEPQFKGVVTVSAFDFGLPDTNNATVVKFMNSLMPAHYLGDLPPRKLAVFQFENDTVVTESQGKDLYDKASQPKEWHLYSGKTHGLYDPVYATDLQAELKGMLGR